MSILVRRGVLYFGQPLRQQVLSPCAGRLLASRLALPPYVGIAMRRAHAVGPASVAGWPPASAAPSFSDVEPEPHTAGGDEQVAKEAPFYVVGGDLGGTRFRAALATNTGEIVARANTLTHAEEGLEAVLARMTATMEQTMEGVDRARVRAVGIAAPGPIDPKTGILYSPPNLPGWGDVPLARILSDRLQLPVFTGNDANLAALAEHRFGAGRGTEHMIYVTVSTGVGGGVIVGGQLLVGNGGASEVGHHVIERWGPRCGCGNYGCLEAFSSGTAIARATAERIANGEASSIAQRLGGNVSRITAEDVVEAARDGDALAKDVLHDAGYSLGIGLANLMHLFDPEVIVLGGGVTNAGPLIFEPMHQALADRVIEPFRQRVRIALAELGDEVGVWGAIALALAECQKS